ncbi:MAG: DUF6484 domain-containing protein [Sandaracinaceae bacterium]
MTEASAKILQLPREPIVGTRTGRLIAVDEAGDATVDYPGNRLGPLPARRLRGVRPEHLVPDAELLLVFADDDPTLPVIVGVVAAPGTPEPPDAVRREGDRVIVDAPGELVLRCGPCTLTLRADGRLKLRAQDILQLAKRRHSIRGGTIRLN